MVAAPASDKKRIAAEAFSAFQKAVTDQGLSLDEYIATLRWRRTIRKSATRYANVFRFRPTSCLAEMPLAVVPGKTHTRRHFDDRIAGPSALPVRGIAGIRLQPGRRS